MASCEHYIDLISARLDGQTSPEEDRALEEHLAACPACRALESQLAAIHASFPELEQPQAPEGFAQGVMARVRAQEAAKKKVIPLFRRPQVRALAGLAACAVLCVGVYRAGVLNWGAGQSEAYSMAASSAGTRQAAPEPRAAAPDVISRDGADAEAPGGQETPAADPEPRSAPVPEPAKQEMPEPADAPAPFSADAPETGLPAGGGSAADVRSGDMAANAGQPQEQTGEPQTDSLDPQPSEDSGSGVVNYYCRPPEAGVQVTAAAAPYEVAGVQVDALLTLPQLPEGAEETLGEETQWLTDEEGRACCVISGTQMEALMALAQEQGRDLTGAATNRIDGEALCGLVLTGEPEPEE